MTSTPTVLIPGLLCSSRLYDPLLPVAWAHVAVTIADTRRDDDVAGVARRLLHDAPPRFVLVGLSMGGYKRTRGAAPGARAGRRAGPDQHVRAPGHP